MNAMRALLQWPVEASDAIGLALWTADEIAAATGGTASGLAFRILEAGYRLNIPRMFAALFLISGAGIAIFAGLGLVSRLVLRRWHDLMDVNAGTIADGTKTIEEVGAELFQLMLDVASGRKKTWAEHWKLHNALVLFNPAPVT